MQIVNQLDFSKEVFDLVLHYIFFGLVLLTLFIFFIRLSIENDSFTFRMIAFILSSVALLYSFLFVFEVNEYSHKERYQVTVTDFNVVYEQGYDIVDRNGEIFTIERVIQEEKERK